MASFGLDVNELQEFDSVVASGHYHSPNVPNIPGLKEWKKRWPDRLQHSKGYRKPDDFKDQVGTGIKNHTRNGLQEQTVLLVGAGVSSIDVGREASHFAKKIYQSSRGGLFDVPLAMLSPETERIAGIASFNLPSGDEDTPGTVTLVDGTVLNDIDRVVICTGYP